MDNYLKRICANCGCTYGSHHGGTSPWPRDYCPGHEGRMDWENGPGTTFKEKAVDECGWRREKIFGPSRGEADS